MSQQKRLFLFSCGYVFASAVGLLFAVFGDVRLIPTQLASLTMPYHGLLDLKDVGDDDYFEGTAVKTITDVKDWWTTVRRRHRWVLLVDCDWDGSVIRCRRPYALFANWYQPRTGYDVVRVEMRGESKLWDDVVGFLAVNLVSSNGRRFVPGAGSILWIENARVVRYEHCASNAMFTHGVETLKTRSRQAFESSGARGRHP